MRGSRGEEPDVREATSYTHDQADPTERRRWPRRNMVALVLLLLTTLLAVISLFVLATRDEKNTSSVITMGGILTCLPPKHEPSTTECMTGLKGEDGRYYALKDEPAGLENDFGQLVIIRGLLTEPDAGSLYESDGTIAVQYATRR